MRSFAVCACFKSSVPNATVSIPCDCRNPASVAILQVDILVSAVCKIIFVVLLSGLCTGAHFVSFDIYKILCHNTIIMVSYIITFVLLVLPSIAMATDGCVHPEQYTIDRRCYVTDVQKERLPYNTVVALVEDGIKYCTGTIIKDENGDLYVYTARLC